MSQRGGEIFQFLQTLCFISYCIADLCNWSGSGLSGDPSRGSVQQVRLRCAAGSVTWLYPAHALRVLLEPNLSTVRHAAVCIKASRAFRGAAVYVERAGELEPLLAGARRAGRVRCFSADRDSDQNRRAAATVFLLADPQMHITRRVASFRYELLRDQSSAEKIRNNTGEAACRPCSDAKILQAICTSDFVFRGSIRNVSHHPERQVSVVEVEQGRVYRQRSGVFERDSGPSGGWQGRVLAPLRCHVRAGPGQFLFTGAEHFGEAWLSCAPRFTHFQTLYRSARLAQKIPCDFPLD